MMLYEIWQWLISFNLFVNENRTNLTDVRIIRIQRLSTRLYLLLLTGAVSVLVIYTSLSMQIVNTTVLTPTLSKYENLLAAYGNTLTCRCSRINIPYGDFVTVTAAFHQVCTSEFISQALIDATFDPLAGFYNPLDIRATLSAQLQLLRSFCQLSQSIISDVLDRLLNTTEMISARLIEPTLLNTQVQVGVTAHRTSAVSVFVSEVSLVRQMSLSNQLMSGLNTNFRASFYPQDGYATGSTGLAVQILASDFQNDQGSWCACQNTYSCHERGGFYSTEYNLQNMGAFTTNDSKLELALPGLISGCIPLESLLSSSLECFYDALCIAHLFQSINLAKPLNITQTSQYAINATINQILSNLMLEQWTSNISFSAFFTKCNVTACTYTTTTTHDLLYVVTTLLGLYGGLTIFLRLTVPIMTKCVFMCSRTCGSVVNLEPLSTRLRILLMHVVHLNLFRTLERSEKVICQQRWTTRLCMVMLTGAMTTLMLYSSLSDQIVSETLTMPTQTEYDHLLHVYGDTVSCPCSRIAIDQDQFILTTYTRVQVCSSDFVASAWLDFLGRVYAWDYYYIDFRLVGLPSFQLLTNLCSLSQQTITDSLFLFQKTQFISSDLLLEEDLRSRANVLAAEFILSTERFFARELALIRVTTQGNQLLTGTYANFGLPVSNGTTNDSAATVNIVPGYFYNPDGSPCFCARNSTCAQLMGIFYMNSFQETNSLLYAIPSFYFGCVISDSVMQSTLECFYDNSMCLKTILFYIMNNTLSINITRLDASRPSQFSVNTTIQVLAYNLFVEEWYTNVSYASYYTSCAPESCTYTYRKRKSILYVTVTLLSIYGGLSVLLRAILPALVNYIMQTIRSRHQRELLSMSTVFSDLRARSVFDRLKSTIRWLISFLSTLNMFNSHGPETMTRYMTRLYLLVLVTTGSVLLLYNGLLEELTQTMTIDTPSLTTFQVLLSKYAQLSCTCSKLAIPYSSFLSLQATSHQICSSDFVSSSWLDRVMGYAGYDNVSALYPNIADFRRQAITQFELLNLFCQLADQRIQDALQTFGLVQFINAQPLLQSDFSEQVKSIVQQFQTSISTEFIHYLMLIRQTTQGNAWLTLYTSSWGYSVREASADMTIFTAPVFYGNCSCATYSTCSQSAGVYVNESFVELAGFRVGCYPLEALLQSSLDCLFNATCVKLLQFYFPPTSNNTPLRVLAHNTSSRYPVHTTVETLINQLLIEQWTINVSYDDFYKQCAPATCVFSYQARKTLLVNVTSLLGLLGGLSVALRILIPITVHVIWMAYEKIFLTRNRVAAANEIVSTF